MMTPQLIEYIKTLRSQNITDENIKQSLLTAGWNAQDIEQGLNPSSSLPLPPSPPPMSSTKPVPQTSMWDAFEHILLFISLYVFATSVALILHQLVDRWLPGISEDSYYRSLNSSWDKTYLRGTLSSLLVSYPLFAFFFLRVINRTKNNPVLRNLKARKTLIYFTLVIAFLIVIGNVIYIIFNFLNGNVTLNFVIHFIITVGISGLIFVYYLNQIKEDRKLYA